MIANELEYSPEETKRTIESLEYEMGSPEEYQVSQLVKVIKGQRELSMLPENGWRDIFCIDCDKSETFFGPVEQFAEELIKLRWAVDSVDRSTAVCPACQNSEPELTERELWEDEAVYAARKGE